MKIIINIEGKIKSAKITQHDQGSNPWPLDWWGMTLTVEPKFPPVVQKCKNLLNQIKFDSAESECTALAASVAASGSGVAATPAGPRVGTTPAAMRESWSSGVGVALTRNVSFISSSKVI